MGTDFPFKVIHCTTWAETKDAFREYPSSWAFRGQRNSSWSLQTSLERSLEPLAQRLTGHHSLTYDIILRLAENLTLHLFKRQILQDFPAFPVPTSKMGWLALIQHHGGPTRLLDWTTSPYVAAFFALEYAFPTAEADSTCAVWGMDFQWFVAQAMSRLQARGADNLTSLYPQLDDIYHDAVFDYDEAGIFPLSLYTKNPRMRNQRGTFMVPGRSDKTLIENLLTYDPDQLLKRVVKVEFPIALRSIALADLDRMRITKYDLFPDLDGLAQDLAVRFSIWRDEDVVEQFLAQGDQRQ